MFAITLFRKPGAGTAHKLWFILVAHLLFDAHVFACSVIPKLGPDGKPVVVEYRFKHEFRAEVLGGTTQIFKTDWGAERTVQGLRVKVTASADPQVQVGTELSIFARGISAGCRPLASDIRPQEFPAGASVLVRTDDLSLAHVARDESLSR